MFIWKVVDDKEGQNFAFPYPSEDYTPIRQTHYRNSRLALQRAVEELSATSLKKTEDLLIENHLHLKNNSDILVSLAHTRGIASAVSAKKSSELFGIGIDCESLHRDVKETIMDKFSHAQDKGLNPLKLWCAKEAAFKASSAFWKNDKTFILKDIVIKNDEFLIDQLGQGRIHFFEEREHLICIAELKQLFSLPL